MRDQLFHQWCDHCNQSLCGLTSETGQSPMFEDLEASPDEGLDCIVCADLRWSTKRKARCLRVVA